MTRRELIAHINILDNETARAHVQGRDLRVIALLFLRIALHARLLFAGPKESTP